MVQNSCYRGVGDASSVSCRRAKHYKWHCPVQRHWNVRYPLCSAFLPLTLSLLFARKPKVFNIQRRSHLSLGFYRVFWSFSLRCVGDIENGVIHSQFKHKFLSAIRTDSHRLSNARICLGEYSVIERARGASFYSVCEMRANFMVCDRENITKLFARTLIMHHNFALGYITALQWLWLCEFLVNLIAPQ